MKHLLWKHDQNISWFVKFTLEAAVNPSDYYQGAFSLMVTGEEF